MSLLGSLLETKSGVGVFIPLTEKAAPNGVATLGFDGKLPTSQLPFSVLEYKGTYDASNNTPILIDGTGNTGDFYKVSVAGTQNLGSGNIEFAIGDSVLYNGTIWQKEDNTEDINNAKLNIDQTFTGNNTFSRASSGDVGGVSIYNPNTNNGNSQRYDWYTQTTGDGAQEKFLVSSIASQVVDHNHDTLSTNFYASTYVAGQLRNVLVYDQSGQLSTDANLFYIVGGIVATERVASANLIVSSLLGACYFGSETEDGTWRIRRDDEDLALEKRISGNWEQINLLNQPAIYDIIIGQQITRIFQDFVQNSIPYTLSLRAPLNGNIRSITLKSSGTSQGTFTVYDDGVAILDLTDVPTNSGTIEEFNINFEKDSEITLIFTGTTELNFEISINYTAIILP